MPAISFLAGQGAAPLIAATPLPAVSFSRDRVAAGRAMRVFRATSLKPRALSEDLVHPRSEPLATRNRHDGLVLVLAPSSHGKRL